jgi:AMP-polyphosphate phosphotransferase
MFASAELGHKIDKETFEREAPKLREALLDVQYELKSAARFPVIVLVNGVDGAGKGETVNVLNEWMDPRLISSVAFGKQNDEERDRPSMWRFWRALPPKGRIGILFGSWYTDPIHRRARDKSTPSELDQSLEQIARFEKMLVHEGALLLKFWFHLSKDAQKKRLRALEKDRRTRWRVTKDDWKAFERYDDYRSVSEHALATTNTGDAPWLVVEGTDEAYRSLTVGRTIERAIRDRLKQKADRPSTTDAPQLVPPIDDVYILDTLDLTKKVEKEVYEDELEALQGKLNRLTRHPRFRDHAVVMVFEGNDAAGKGGTIRRVTAALDARQYNIVPIAAPTEEERAQPYLWRFWRHVPKHSGITIFDRSWYGRVLVERVEGFCTEADYLRAYGEINDFEAQLTEKGIIVVKFWLAISKDEQLKRFREREKIEWKRFKIGEEDWRNRRKWKAYAHAVHDMVERTNPDEAPWTIVEANDKRHARLTVLRTLVERIEAALE